MAPNTFNIAVWKEHLDGAVASGHLPASHRDSLLLSLKEGFRLGVDPSLPIPTKVRHAMNLKGTHVNKADYDPEVTLKILQSLKREIQLGRTAGPFCAPPFPNLQISPIGAVPKNHSAKLRVIHHLSYPRNESKTSVNSRLTRAPCKYLRFHAVLDTIARIGPTCLLAKIDVKDAFRLLRVHKDDHYNLGIKFSGFYMYERCISFGVHCGPAHYESLATAVEAIINSKGVKEANHYLDDSLIISTPESAARDYEGALKIFQVLGIPLSEDKLAPPSPNIEFLGIEIDCPSMEIRVPQDKVARYRKEIAAAKSSSVHGWMTLTSLQSLLGMLRHCNVCVQRGNLFLHYLQRALNVALRVPMTWRSLPSSEREAAEMDFDSELADLTATDTPREAIDPTPVEAPTPGIYQRLAQLDQFATSELGWWDRCLVEWNGVTLIPPSPSTNMSPRAQEAPPTSSIPDISTLPHSSRSAGTYSLLTDACNTGMGAWLVAPDGRAFYLLHAWSDVELQQSTRVKRLSMPFLELLAVVLAVLSWQKELANSVVHIRSDCLGVVHALTKDYSQSPQSHQLLLSLYLITTVNHIAVHFSHIDGVDNVEADALSRAASIDTHQQDSLLETTFFPLPSVVCFSQGRLQRSPLSSYQAETIFMPSGATYNTKLWRNPHTRRTTTGSSDSGTSASITTSTRSPTKRQ